MSILSQKLKVQKTGFVRDGEVTYSVDTDTGAVNYQGKIKAGLSDWFAKEIPFGGPYKLDVATLKSAGKKSGDVIKIGNLVITVRSIVKGVATCALDLEVSGSVYHGTALVDVSGLYIRIKSLEASGKYGAFDVKLVATAV